MVTFEEAYSIVMKHAVPIGTERVSMTESSGRVLAEDLFSDTDLPSFDRSAVDGFACRRSDLGSDLEVLETIPAGKVPESMIRDGTCSKIMTGSMVPEGADCVVMVEDILVTEDGRIRYTKKDTATNIRFTGEDLKAGDRVLTTGTRIRPQHVAVLAATGAVNPMVYRRPRVGILSTGDELVEPEHIPSPSRIRNSNAAQLISQTSEAGALPDYGGIAPDHEDTLSAMLADSLDRNNILLLTGGVSMGDFDYVPEVLERSGFEVLFKSIAIQPGRPTLFGRKGNQFVFGLPGNPVSCFVLFEMLVKPFLLGLAGGSEKPVILRLPAGTSIRRKKSVRKSMIPVKIVNREVFPVDYHGSAHINSYTDADGILSIEIGNEGYEKGDLADVRLL